MTDTQINAFLAVAHHGNFTKAADSLFISEPALSRSILLLEKELGYTLIERRKGARSQTLTSQGKQFLLIAERWKILLTEARNLDGDKNTEMLRIAATESFSNYLLPPVYDQCLQLRPSLHLMIDTLHTQELHNQINLNLYDLALASWISSSKNIETRELFREKIVIVSPRGMFSEDKLHPSGLDPSREIMSSWAPDYQAWGEFWFGPDSRSRVYLRTLFHVPQFILNHNMWTFMPASAACCVAKQYPVQIHDIINGPPDRICYVLQNRLFRHPDAELFIQLVREEASKLEGITLSANGQSAKN